MYMNIQCLSCVELLIFLVFCTYIWTLEQAMDMWTYSCMHIRTCYVHVLYTHMYIIYDQYIYIYIRTMYIVHCIYMYVICSYLPYTCMYSVCTCSYMPCTCTCIIPLVGSVQLWHKDCISLHLGPDLGPG